MALVLARLLAAEGRVAFDSRQQAYDYLYDKLLRFYNIRVQSGGGGTP